MKICVFNLGCKVNKYESDSIARSLREKGHEVICELGKADVYVLNTCAVTNEAERKSRQCVTRCLRLNPAAKVIVAGCASQANAEQFGKKAGVVFVSGVAGKNKIAEEIEKRQKGGRRIRIRRRGQEQDSRRDRKEAKRRASYSYQASRARTR